MKVLVTGVAGFIGFHLAQRLINDNIEVIGIDNLNNYYDVSLKNARLSQLKTKSEFTFHYLELSDRQSTDQLFQSQTFDVVVHLAAQAGVRYSLENASAYIDSNLVGFANILEGCRHSKSQHLIFASSSSVYGKNQKIPFSVKDNVDHPISLYAATKKANELMAYTYSHLYNLPTTGLRFFTVYGPWGRPDMAYFKFVNLILSNQEIPVYNYGNMKRDFTYIDDVIEGIIRLINHPPKILIANETDPSPYKIYNIGNNKPVNLSYFISVIENILGEKANIQLLPMQPGDVPVTFADVDDLIQEIGFKPSTSIEEGMQKFIHWHKNYYKI